MKKSTYLVTGLVRLHRELARTLILTEQEAEKIRNYMEHVEYVLHLIEPDFSARQIAILRRRKWAPGEKRGAIMRNCYVVLGAARKPLSVAEIADKVAARRGLDISTKKARDRLRNSIYSSLKFNDGKTVKSNRRFPSLWTLQEPIATKPN